MFKKTLVASALALAAFGSQAVVVTVPGATTVSQEGSVGAASVTLPNVVATLGAEYTVNDTITFTITGAEFLIASSTPVLTYVDASGGGGDGTMTLGLLNSTATTVTFRITDLVPNTGDAVTTADTLTLSGMVLTTTTVTDAVGAISVAHSARTNNNLVLDSAGTPSLTALTVVAQLSSSVTKALNGIIDVNNDRQQFTLGNDSIVTDVLVVTPVEAVAAVNDVTYSVATHTIKGDFSFMNTNATAGVDAGELAAAFVATAAGDDVMVSTINAAMDTITVTATDAGADAVEAHTFTFTVAGAGTDNAVLNTQSFTISTSLAFDAPVAAASTKVIATDAAAGAWTLNGSVVEVPYMPFGPNTQPILRHTNTGTKSGSVSVRYMEEGVDTSWKTLGVVVAEAGPGVRNLLTPVMDAVVAATGKTSGKVALEITTNVPDGDVTVFAAAKITTSDSDRLTIGAF
ncbi:hypothetical protein [Paraglaciecola sp.]|uniref:hypothetical protein n=1 Tax=Paraglaciecola sp. TaxID=1920173 RepID=UPI0030F3A96B